MDFKKIVGDILQNFKEEPMICPVDGLLLERKDANSIISDIFYQCPKCGVVNFSKSSVLSEKQQKEAMKRLGIKP